MNGGEHTRTGTKTDLRPLHVDTGAQPLVNDDGTLILAVNGEIYNHVALRKGLKNKDAVFKTHSDCEVIMHLVSHSFCFPTRFEHA